SRRWTTPLPPEATSGVAGADATRIPTPIGGASVPLNRTLGFCSAYGGGDSISSCCDAAADAVLRKRSNAMNSVLCADCSPFPADSFNSNSKIHRVPLLCNYTSSSISSAQAKDSARDYCKLIWEACKNVKIVNSPFQPLLQGSARPQKTIFCTSFGGSSGNGSYLNMASHPDGSNRVFLSSQAGKIWLASIPKQGSGGTPQYDPNTPQYDPNCSTLADPYKFQAPPLSFPPQQPRAP
ncbi:hypothetical protein ACJX0J_017687, partial [Zea mays]